MTEIIVTANKREERLNDVGVTAAVFGADALKQRQVNSLADIAKLVPGLSYTIANNGTPIYNLRGVGFNESTLGAFPAVSVYLDQAPLPFPVLTSHSAFDLERLEVLKGPQGTLFGENATGGAINFIAAKPTDHFEAGGSLSIGRFAQVIGEGYVSGPISDTLNYRISARAERTDGWQESNTRPGDRNGAVKNFMGRVQLAFQPTDGLRFLLNVNGWLDRSETQSGQYIAFQPQNNDPPGVYQNPILVATPFSPLTARASDWATSSYLYDHKIPFAKNSMLQASLRSDVDISDWGTLTSLTSFVTYKANQGNATDGLTIHALDLPLTLGRINVFNQELRLSNGGGHRLRYVLGGNFERDVVKQDYFIDYSGSSAKIRFGETFGLPVDAGEIDSKQRMTTYAMFGNADYDITSNLTLKGGVRYTNYRNQGAVCETDPRAPYYIGQLLYIFGGLYNSGNPAQYLPYKPGDCAALNINPTNNTPAVDYLPFGAPGGLYQTLKENNFAWHAGIDYKPSPGLLLYFNASKGYKAGSFPAASATSLQQYMPVKQESVMAYEAGFKATLLDRRLQLNGAGFYYDYTDKQLRTKLFDPVFGQLDVIENVPKSSIRGFELEATYQPVHGFTIAGAYTYLDAKIDRYVGTNAGGDAVPVNFAGTRIPFTPKHQFALNANYEQPVSSRLTVFAGASVTYRTNTISVVGGDTNPGTVVATSVPKVYGIDGYALVDAQLGVKSSDGTWRAFIWGKNIFDKYYWNNVVSGYDTVARFTGMPATYGLTLSVKVR